MKYCKELHDDIGKMIPIAMTHHKSAMEIAVAARWDSPMEPAMLLVMGRKFDAYNEQYKELTDNAKKFMPKKTKEELEAEKKAKTH